MGLYARREHWHKLITLNVLAPVWATQEALRTMRAARKGAIVNVSSAAGLGLAPHGSDPRVTSMEATTVRGRQVYAPVGRHWTVSGGSQRPEPATLSRQTSVYWLEGCTFLRCRVVRTDEVGARRGHWGWHESRVGQLTGPTR